MRKRFIGLALAALMLTTVFTGCGGKSTAVSAEADPIVITIAGSWEDCRAIEAVGRKFTEIYPECSIVYENLQDYYNSLEKRMTGENMIDIFFTVNIQQDSQMLPYAFDLNSSKIIDLSKTFDGLKDNFVFREDGAVSKKLYAIPLGAEMRGLYVNKTLLGSLGLTVPTDQASLLSACEVLKQNGYIPLQSNPGDFSQTLMYPWICNIIANADNPQEVYDKVNSRDFKAGELFAEPIEFLYSVVENGYYDYKRAQTELNLFNDTTDVAYARDFLNIVQNGDSFEKADDVGRVAFMPSPMSAAGVIEKTKEDYHSKIEYEFIPAPIGKDGGFAYMSPAHGIAINKNSQNLEWSEKFIDFLFTPEYNELFAKEFNIIPNTEKSFEYVSTLYDIPADRISQLGQVTFDYDFYNIFINALRDISKANNPKYMQTEADGSVKMYPLDYYVNALEESIKENEK